MIEEIKEKLVRKAILMKMGGFRPSDDPMESWFGKINFCQSGETWPISNGKPMLPLCQVNLTTLPIRPPRLDDINFITVFIDQDDIPIDTPNGDGWCIRVYKELSELVPIDQPEIDSPIKPFQMKPEIVEEDFPCHEDIPIDLPEEIDDEYYDLFENRGGFKLGGWPTLLQSEIFWAPFNKHPLNPEFVFQIDSDEKVNWFWGDSGVAYFGRGTTDEGKDQWTMAWQCY